MEVRCAPKGIQIDYDAACLDHPRRSSSNFDATANIVPNRYSITDTGRLHEDTGDKSGPEIMVAPDSEAPSNPRIAAATHESPSAAEARHSADLYIRTSWVDAALALSELEKVQ
ncbi:hypothetical protein RR46_12025 [Papilio xuthus]|uniref:Uncharacterized protein n=1 Tax=Papilio xuthus TaxID=66420 RepID=A0A194PNL2_PAPXU|nr:hypothetical protein RR46_12025 [Papilio xuthus]